MVMELRQLTDFVAVAEEGTFTATATKSVSWRSSMTIHLYHR